MDIKDLLIQALKQNASDLHLSEGTNPMIRVDGELEPISDYSSMTGKQIKEIIYSSLSSEQKAFFENKLEIDYAYRLNNYYFRIHAFHQAKGTAAACRIIPPSIPTPEQLNLPPSCINLCNLSKGLILVTGPTGSGKSTTLATLINYINLEKRKHIVTIEDPIEYHYTSQKSLINQREVKKDTHSFQSALKSVLREDPDIIMVGELRDLQTVRLALTAAETGHLVFATLHTNSAAQTVDRIIDIFPGEEKAIIRSMLAESLQAIIAQILIKRIGGGRVAAFEVLINTPAIRNLIRENKISQLYSIIQISQSQGMFTLGQYLEKLIKDKIIEKSN